MKTLDTSLYPTVGDIGFLRAPMRHCIDSYIGWLQPIYESIGVTLTASRCSGSLEHALRRLLPLTNVKEQRFLFMPTSGPWTAFFTNGFEPDVSTPMAYLARTMHVEAVRICNVPDNATSEFPSRIFELFGPNPKPILNTIRSIYAVYDGSSWEFDASGELQSFEEPAMYAMRRIQERFTSGMIERYAAALGIHCFEEIFYTPEDAFVVEKSGPTPTSMRTMSSFPGLTLK